jgi:hypothetical protein
MGKVEDLEAKAVSLGAALPKMPALVPYTTKSYSRFPVLSPNQWSVSATSMLAAPYGVPLAPGTYVINATTDHRRTTGTNNESLLSPRHHISNA